MIVGHPVAQTFNNHITHVGVIAVQRVTASAEVEVTAIQGQHVVGLVVDTSVGDIRPVFVTFCRMVEHHVENHLNAVGMQLFDQVLQLVHLHGEPTRRSVCSLGSEEAHIAIPPQVVKHVPVNG